MERFYETSPKQTKEDCHDLIYGSFKAIAVEVHDSHFPNKIFGLRPDNCLRPFSKCSACQKFGRHIQEAGLLSSTPGTLKCFFLDDQGSTHLAECQANSYHVAAQVSSQIGFVTCLMSLLPITFFSMGNNFVVTGCSYFVLLFNVVNNLGS